jgi:anti-sigma factor RsiW
MIEMHDHDFDLMAALADGTASPAEAAAAERAVTDCAECAAEHRAQIEVLEFLRSALPVSMTDMERATLHRTLRQAAPSPRVGWFSRYAPRIAAVAAGFAVVGLASVTMLDRGPNDEASDTAALPVAADSIEQEARDGEAGAPVFDAPAEETQELSQSAGDDSDFVAGAADESATAPTAPLEITEADLKYFEDNLSPETAVDFEGLAEETAARCSEHLPSQLQPSVAAEVLFEGTPAIVLVYTSGGDTVIAALETVNCELLAEFVIGP